MAVAGTVEVDGELGLDPSGFEESTRTRSASRTASSMLWVTMSMARVGKSSRAQSEEFGAEVLGGENVERGEGSSMKRASGSTTSARAKPTRWRIPPESSLG